MKPTRVILGIFAGIVLITGAMLLRGRIVYNADAQKIEGLIGDIRTLGYATNGSEFFHKIPDEENAWTKIESVVYDQTSSKQNQDDFKSDLCGDLATVGTPDDLATIDRYLNYNHSKLALIARFLSQNSKIQVPKDYDQGAMMLYGELVPLRTVGREFCLTAFASALRGDWPETEKNLDFAVLITNYFYDRGEWLPLLIGHSMRTIIETIASRIAEEHPKFIPNLKAYFLTSSSRFHQPDIHKIIQSRFLQCVATCRYYDLPIMDRHPLPWPFNNLQNNSEKEDDDLLNVGTARHGDYIPKSPTMRSLLLKYLQIWRPILGDLKAHPNADYIPPAHLFDAFDGIAAAVPKALYNEISVGDQLGVGYSDLTVIIHKFQRQHANEQAIWNVLDYRAKFGRYPVDLRAASPDIPDSVVYARTKGGFTIQSKEMDIFGKPISILYFPFKDGVKPETIERYKSRLEQYRAGKIDELGHVVK